MADQGPPAPPSLFPASMAQGFSLVLSQAQTGAQLMVNQQAQMAQAFFKNAQQTQVNVLNTLNQLLVGPAAQMARPPLIPLEALGKGGEGISPMGFFPEWAPAAVKEKTSKEVPYYPLTEGQLDYTKGGFTAAPQQEIPNPPAPRGETARPFGRTEFF